MSRHDVTAYPDTEDTGDRGGTTPAAGAPAPDAPRFSPAPAPPH